MSQQYTPRQLGILRHALGLKIDGRGDPRRNHFVTGPGSDDFDDCEALVSLDYMTKRKIHLSAGGGYVYYVTDTGMAIAKATGASTT